ncbi:hypothetical protein DPEC_G00064140 [Dallia pectoralis]|uniref:Uncharacterized protein n=1 Tax=Dallia pectoralis TaxID=75939 RepID=A0ACC2H7L9_DALPE|nr:hypothetical protein DPEC_G00064140 [Dallia pectoralis]
MYLALREQKTHLQLDYSRETPRQGFQMQGFFLTLWLCATLSGALEASSLFVEGDRNASKISDASASHRPPNSEACVTSCAAAT